MNLKIGDILIAKRFCRIPYTENRSALKIGKEYKITGVFKNNQTITIKSEELDVHHFSSNKDIDFNLYYFFTVKDSIKSMDKEISIVYEDGKNGTTESFAIKFATKKIDHVSIKFPNELLITFKK